MKPRISVMSIILLIFGGVAVARAPQTPTPGPEIKRLHYFVGTWKTEYNLKPGPMGPGGKMSAVDQSRMMPGGFFLETRTDGNGAIGVLNGLSIMGYDAVGKVYTYDSFNNYGEADHFKGEVQGDTWTWTSESALGGKPTRMRFTAKEVSPAMYTMKFEIATDGDWTTVMEGKATKETTPKMK
ncbi:MAG TPA: DUF1579 family protein [Blastocatellia bacterium]|nr:DUF1579 family protein [Blastocatellia bacterium]